MEKNPNHIAVIMDGNGRWARSKGLDKNLGHKEGSETIKRMVSCVIKLNIPYLTLYAFSSENWKRPKEEVSDLIELFKFYLKVEIDNINKQNIKLSIIGDRVLLNQELQNSINQAEKLTENNKLLNLNIAFNYGGRQEIIEATKVIAQKVKFGDLEVANINEKMFNNYLYTKSLPSPDLLIRTSGEYRISNFLLWQLAYTEFFFTSTLWPDFSEEDFNEAISAYKQRNRRYGKR